MDELTLVTSLMPAMSLADAAERRNAVVAFTRQIMVQGTDYGEIPGTSKPTLLKPGAEKLCTHFGLTPTFERVDAVKDWTGREFGEPLFYFEYRCKLWRGQHLIAEGIGSCNSWEKKYRYREAKRVCPACGTPAIIKGKAEYGGGWLCFKKQGGCGAKYPDGDAAIEGQASGLVANPDIFDLVNTIDKMSQKRALVAATLIGVNASEFFTQDVEDIVIIGVQDTNKTERVDTKTGEVHDTALPIARIREQLRMITRVTGDPCTSETTRDFTRLSSRQLDEFSVDLARILDECQAGTLTLEWAEAQDRHHATRWKTQTAGSLARRLGAAADLAGVPAQPS